MNIGDRIKTRRVQLGLSQEELAAKLGYKSRSTINKIELGVNDITQSKVSSLAKARDTTPAYLMGWDDEQLPSMTTKELSEIDSIFSELTPSRQTKLLELARLYLDDQRKSEETK